MSDENGLLRLWRTRVQWFAAERAEKGFIRSDIADLLHCTSSQARTVLGLALSEKLIRMVGAGRSARYYAPEFVEQVEAWSHSAFRRGASARSWPLRSSNGCSPSAPSAKSSGQMRLGAQE